MISEPCFVVVMCTHNGVDFIDAQLDTLSAQTLAPDYIQLHDWQSDDGTRARLRSWAAGNQGPAQVSLHEHASVPGPCASFLAAIELALAELPKATHVLFCDQDDLWSPDKLSVYREALMGDELRPDLLFSDVRLVGAEGELLHDSFYRRRGSPYRALVLLSSPELALVNPAIGMTVCVSRRLAERLVEHAQAPWAMHDWAAAMLCEIYAWPSAFLPRPLADYRQHSASLRGAPSFSQAFTKLRRMRRRFKDLQALGDWFSVRASEEEARAHTLLPRTRFSAIAKVAMSRNLRLWYRATLGTLALLLW